MIKTNKLNIKTISENIQSKIGFNKLPLFMFNFPTMIYYKIYIINKDC